MRPDGKEIGNMGVILSEISDCDTGKDWYENVFDFP